MDIEDMYRDDRDYVDDGCRDGDDYYAVYQPQGHGGKVEQLYKPWTVAPKSNNRKDGANRGQHRVPSLPLQKRGQERKCAKDNRNVYSRRPFLSFIIKDKAATGIDDADRTADQIKCFQ